jgi:hypothetical protein
MGNGEQELVLSPTPLSWNPAEFWLHECASPSQHRGAFEALP